MVGQVLVSPVLHISCLILLHASITENDACMRFVASTTRGRDNTLFATGSPEGGPYSESQANPTPKPLPLALYPFLEPLVDNQPQSRKETKVS